MDDIERSNLSYDLALELIGVLDGYLDNLEETGAASSKDVLVLRNTIGDLLISFIMFDFIRNSNIDEKLTDAIIDKRLESIKETVKGFLDSVDEEDDKYDDFISLFGPSNN